MFSIHGYIKFDHNITFFGLGMYKPHTDRLIFVNIFNMHLVFSQLKTSFENDGLGKFKTVMALLS